MSSASEDVTCPATGTDTATVDVELDHKGMLDLEVVDGAAKVHSRRIDADRDAITLIGEANATVTLQLRAERVEQTEPVLRGKADD